MKKILSIVLAVLLIAALGTTAFADDPVSPKTQLQLMAALIDSLKQDDSTRTWYYCVTDLDHDGCLEFLAASLHPVDRSTNLKVWIVSPDGKTLNNAQLVKDSADESFPDIMADTVDTYHVADTDTWYYMVNDNVVISDSEVYTVKTAVNLKNGVLDYDTYAVEHTVVDSSGNRNVSCTDMNGLGISAEQYNAAGTNNFAGASRSNTAFEWLVADEILAVGDAAFQAKSKARMMELMHGGTTVLFVSHDLGQIREMCDKALWLEHGEVKMLGEAAAVCDAYQTAV